jgi:glutathione S-transferase
VLVLYRTDECPRCTRIEQLLGELRTSHRVVAIDDPGQLPASLPRGTRLPALRDGGALVEGSRAILEHLDGTGAFEELWYKFQSDACYCDDEGKAL